jgi:hypothetical protein
MEGVQKERDALANFRKRVAELEELKEKNMKEILNFRENKQRESERQIEARQEAENAERELNKLTEGLDLTGITVVPEDYDTLVEKVLSEQAQPPRIPITTQGFERNTVQEILSCVPAGDPDVVQPGVGPQRLLNRSRYGEYVVVSVVAERIGNAIRGPCFGLAANPIKVLTQIVPNDVYHLALENAFAVCKDAERRGDNEGHGGLGYSAMQDLGASWQAIYATCGIVHAMSTQLAMIRACPLAEQEAWLRGGMIWNIATTIAACALFPAGSAAMLGSLGLAAGIFLGSMKREDVAKRLHETYFTRKGVFEQLRDAIRGPRQVYQQPAHLVNNYDLMVNSAHLNTLMVELPTPFQLCPPTRDHLRFRQPLLVPCQQSNAPGGVAIAAVGGQPSLELCGHLSQSDPDLITQALPSLDLHRPSGSTPLQAINMHSSVACCRESSWAAECLLIHSQRHSWSRGLSLKHSRNLIHEYLMPTSESRRGVFSTGNLVSQSPSVRNITGSSPGSQLVAQQMTTEQLFSQRLRNDPCACVVTTRLPRTQENTWMTETSTHVKTALKSASARMSALGQKLLQGISTTATGFSLTLTQQTSKLANFTQRISNSLVVSSALRSIVQGSTPPTTNRRLESLLILPDYTDSQRTSLSSLSTSSITSKPQVVTESDFIDVHSLNLASPTQQSQIPSFVALPILSERSEVVEPPEKTSF